MYLTMSDFDKFYLGLNFKANLNSLKANQELVASYLKLLTKHNDLAKKIEFQVFPEDLFLLKLQEEFGQSVIQFGSQNMPSFSHGSYTGRISGASLQNLKLKPVLVGHSETRKAYHLGFQDLKSKLILALNFNFIPVYCLGFTQSKEREIDFPGLQTELEEVLLSPEIYPNLARIKIAYEPVWAIGQAAATETEIAEIFHFLDKILAQNNRPAGYIYGGGVSLDNFKQLILIPRLSGFLLGRAALDVSTISEIITFLSSPK